jgi:hypothetical protein
MKAITKHFLALFFVLVLTLGIFPNHAEAYFDEIFTVNTPKKSTWVSANGYTFDRGNTRNYYYTVNKISVPADSYVIIETDKAANLSIYSKYDKNKPTNSNNFICSTSKIKKFIKVLPKGNYWIINRNADETVKMRWSYKKVKAPTNYTRSRAIDLTRSKKATIFQPYGKEFDRWFKVRTKSKSLTFTMKLLDSTSSYSNFQIYDSNGKYIRESNHVRSNNTYKFITEKLASGTYYIHVDTSSISYNNKYSDARLAEFSWK